MTLISTAPAITKRISDYDRVTKDYHAFVSIDGGAEQYLGSRPSQGAADRLCDEYAFNYYADNHTPEAAARIAVETFAPKPHRPDPGAAIVRQWATDRAYFMQTLSNLEIEDIYQMARAAVAHCAQRVPRAPVTVDQMLAAWQAAAEGVTS